MNTSNLESSFAVYQEIGGEAKIRTLSLDKKIAFQIKGEEWLDRWNERFTEEFDEEYKKKYESFMLLMARDLMYFEIVNK